MYKRILLKLSGEVMCGKGKIGIEAAQVSTLVGEIANVVNKFETRIGIVIGGGNIIRGANVKEIDRVIADHMGMLGTLINSLYLRESLEKNGIISFISSAIPFNPVVESISIEDVRKRLSKGEVAIFACGTGEPFFSTDTAAALRGIEFNAEILMKATKVDGVYDKDPEVYPNAQRFENLSYDDAMRLDVKVIDMAAIAMCRDARIPILVFDLFKKGNLKKAILGESVGTMITTR